MQYRKLGRTDIEVSVISHGAWSLISDDFNWGHNDLKDSLAALHASLDAGINFFDTAEGYGAGESEQILGRALGKHRREVVIASKVAGSHLRREEVIAACERSLKNLGTDYIDLYQVHWPSREVPLRETMSAMRQLREAGKIRMIGVSNFGPDYLDDLAATGRAESNQLPYSLLWRAIEHEVLPRCIDEEMSVLCYSPLCQGLLTGKFATPEEVPAQRARTRLFSGSRPNARHGEEGCEEETFRTLEHIRNVAGEIGEPMGRVALAWLVAQPGVGSVIVGGRNAAQARENAAAANLALSSDTRQALAAATATLKEHIGPNCDMWEHCSRMEKSG